MMAEAAPVPPLPPARGSDSVLRATAGLPSRRLARRPTRRALLPIEGRGGYFTDEFLVDYATTSGAGGFSMSCRCGAAMCRGEVTSADWKRLELQDRYRGHWVPALQEQIDRG